MEAVAENATATSPPAAEEQKPADAGVQPAPAVDGDATANADQTTSAPAPSGDQSATQSTDAAAAAATANNDAPEAAAAAAAVVETPPVEPRVVIVTGASSGLGFEVTKVLCEAGHDVILACRNEEKTNRAIEKIRKQNAKAQTTFMQLDLASLESVRKFVENFRATGKKLSVLINNAGVGFNFKDTKRQYTTENFELTMGTNHLGHFLLTNLLLDDLKQTAKDGGDARIVVVSSGLHDTDFAKKKGPVQPLELDNLFLLKENTYTGLQAYKNSKLANVLFTYELGRQLEGSGVKVNAVDPGFVPTTELMRHASSVQKFVSRYVLHGMLRFAKITRTASQSGSLICALATGDKFKDTTGKYIRDGAEVKSSEESLDEEKQKKLWELSGGYTHLEGFEPLEAPTPPPEPVKEEPKPEQKPEEAVNGDAAKTAPETANGDAAKVATEADNNQTSDESNKTTEKNEDANEKAEVDNKVEEKKDVENEKEEEKKETIENKD